MKYDSLELNNKGKFKLKLFVAFWSLSAYL